MKDAKLIISIFNTFYKGSAAITGGYWRDALTGRKPKDIDIVIKHESTLDLSEIFMLACRLGYAVNVFESYENAGKTTT